MDNPIPKGTVSSRTGNIARVPCLRAVNIHGHELVFGCLAEDGRYVMPLAKQIRLMMGEKSALG